MKRLIRALVLLPLLATTACAIVGDDIEVRYPPVAAVTPVSGAGAVAVTIATQDKRPEERGSGNRISAKRNGFYMEMASITASNDVVAETGRAIMAELAARGFREGAGVKVEVDVRRFFNRFTYVGVAVSDVQVTVRVRGADGNQIYTRDYQGQGSTSAPFQRGANAAESLQQAMRAMTREAMSDPGFIAALTSANAPVAAATGLPRS